jgi:hypothetical protein
MSDASSTGIAVKAAAPLERLSRSPLAQPAGGRGAHDTGHLSAWLHVVNEKTLIDCLRSIERRMQRHQVPADTGTTLASATMNAMGVIRVID